MKSNYAAKMQQFADECSFIAAQVKLTQNDSTTESGKIFQYVVFILLHGEFFIFWCTLIIGCFGARSSSNAIFLNARKLAYATVQPVGFTFTLQARTIASFHTTPTHVCMRNNAQRAALGSKKKKMCFLKIRELLLNLTPQSSCSTSNISSVFSNFQHVLDAFCLKYITISIFCKLSSCCFSFEDRSFMCTLLQKYRKLF